MRKPLALTCSLCFLWISLAVGGSIPPAIPSSPGAGGSIVGTVSFLETPPEPERLRVDRNNDVCGLRKFSQEFIVSDETKGLKNVVLTVEGAPASKSPPEGDPTITQKGCEYSPHVLTAVVGQNLQIRNSDPILHNIHAYDDKKATLFNLGQPIQDQVNSVKLETEGVMTVQCDVHAWMQAYVVVAPHPYIAVTDEDGSFRIDGVPAGAYKLKAWHEGLGTMDKDVTVTAGQETNVKFEVGK